MSAKSTSRAASPSPDPNKVAKVRRRVHEAVESADPDSLLMAEAVLAASSAPRDPSILLEAIAGLVKIAQPATEERDDELCRLRRRLAQAEGLLERPS